MNSHSRPLLVFLCAAIILFLACRTLDLIGGAVSNGARPTAARAAKKNAATALPKAQGTPDPNAAFEYIPLATPRCGVGDNGASVVTGRIMSGNAPVVGQKIQASSGPGAEPISDEPAVTDENGNYQVTFVCDGKACNGSFWIWLVDDEFVQISPFVKFIFDNQCRSGTLNFRSR